MKEKKHPLRVLYLENITGENNLVVNFLHVSLPDFEIKYAKTEKEFLKFLLRFKPEVILSGYKLEKYSASEAFQFLRDEGFKIPFIVIAEKLSEEISHKLISQGVEDCIIYANLGLLPAAIIKAIEKYGIHQEKNKIEVELKNEQKRLGTIFENTPEAIINIGFHGEILEINPTGCQILQVEMNSGLKKKSIFNFIHHDDLKKFKKLFNSVGIGNKKTETFRIVGAKNKEHWVETSAFPLFDEDNHIISVVTFNRDITDLVKANDKIEYTEEKFRKLTMHAPVGIFLTDEKGDSTYVNERWCELTGLKEKNALNNGWIKALYFEDREAVFKEWYNCALEGKEFKMNYRIQKPSGEIKWIQGGAVALRNNADKIYGYIGTITDISEVKKYEDSIKEHELRLLSIQEIANVGYWNYNPIKNKGMWSRQIFKIHERDEKNGYPSFDEFLENVHPDDRSLILEFQNKVMDSNMKLHLEFRLVINGKVKEITVSAQAIKKSQSGELIKIMGTFMDITEQKAIEKKAAVYENQFKDLFENSPDAIYVEDENGVILNANSIACDFQGYSKEELIGKNIYDLIPDQFKPIQNKDLILSLKLDGSLYENFRWDRNGIARPVEIKTSKINYKNKPALLVHARDITQRKKAEKASRELEIKFQTLAKEAPVAIYQMDNHGNFILVNKKFIELFEMSEKEIKKHGWKSRIHPDDLSHFMKTREENMGKTSSLEIYYRLFIRGRIKCVIGKSSPIINDEGEVTGRIGTILEVTEPKQTQENLRIV